MRESKKISLEQLMKLLVEFIVQNEMDNYMFFDQELCYIFNKNRLINNKNKYTVLTYDLYSEEYRKFIPINLEFFFIDNNNVLNNVDDKLILSGQYQLSISIDVVIDELIKNYDGHEYLKKFTDILKIWKNIAPIQDSELETKKLLEIFKNIHNLFAVEQQENQYILRKSMKQSNLQN